MFLVVSLPFALPALHRAILCSAGRLARNSLCAMQNGPAGRLYGGTRLTTFVGGNVSSATRNPSRSVATVTGKSPSAEYG